MPLISAANELPCDPSLPAALLSHPLPAPRSRMAERTDMNLPSRASSDPPEVCGYLLVGGWALLKCFFWERSRLHVAIPGCREQGMKGIFSPSEEHAGLWGSKFLGGERTEGQPPVGVGSSALLHRRV